MKTGGEPWRISMKTDSHPNVTIPLRPDFGGVIVLPPRKRLCLAPGPRFEVRESSSAAARPTRGYKSDYGFIGTMDADLRRYRDTDGIYVRFKDTQDDRALLRGQVNMLRRDRHYHLNTAMLVESEARVTRKAWA
ncbi:hypothetical protein Tco_0691888 [Tanacetum coccineum]